MRDSSRSVSASEFERPALGGVEIGDDLLPAHGVEAHGGELLERLQPLRAQARRLLGGLRQRDLQFVFLAADLARGLLDLPQRLLSRDHSVHHSRIAPPVTGIA